MEKNTLEESNELNIQFNKRGGIIPVIVQEQISKDVLMLGYANLESFKKTIISGKATFWSTSRAQIWTKGETSGDYLSIVDIYIDCDQDALIYLVKMEGGGTCHTKNSQGKHRRSCFYRLYRSDNDELKNLDP